MEQNPEVRRRIEEILEVAKSLTDDEKANAIFNFAQTKWQRLRNENPSMRAGNGDEKENPKKVQK
jgi:hypothetical protein